MSYWINKIGNSNRANWRQFYCDKDNDIDNLPNSATKGKFQEVDTNAYETCSIGSVCKVLETGKIFVLGSNNIWTKIPINNQTSGGDSGSDSDDEFTAVEF